jgi:cell wall-associated NlpC family hydrolase
MKTKKTLRLLAASWLIAPTILAAHPVFADDQTPQSSDVGAITGSSAEATTTTTSSSESTEDTAATTDSSQTPEAAAHTLFIDTALASKVQFKTADGQLLDVSSGSLSGLAEGTKIAYTIQPNEGEEIVSVEITGADAFSPEANQLSGTFVIGKQDATFKAVFQPIESSTDSSTEDTSTAPSTDETTDSSTAPSTDGTTDSSTPPGNGNQGNNNNNNNGNTSSNNNSGSGSASTGGNNNRPTNNHQNNSSNAGQPSRPNQPASGSNTNNASNPRPASDPLAVAGTDSSRFVTKTPVEATLPTNTTAVQRAIVEEAFKHIGAPYVWGARGPSSFDCSGLTQFVYLRATGHNIGAWTGEQQYAGTHIPVSQAQPGDLLFWGPSTGVTHHVAIYIGDGKFIHAPQPNDSVRVTSISDFTPDFAVRVNISGLPTASGSLTLGGSSVLDGLNQFHFSRNQTTDQFLAKISDFAQEIGQREGLYASVMLAQAILESGSGNSLLSTEPNHNLFGIKGSFEGSSVSFNTLEQDEQGNSYQIRAQFRKYPSYKESLEDYADLIKNGISGNKDFYKPAWKSEAATYREATAHLQGRYATDRQYAQKLNAIIEAYDLTQYDEPKEEKNQVTNQSTRRDTKIFTVPVRWSSQQRTTDPRSPFAFRQTSASSFLSGFAGFKIASVWDIFYHFSANQIPPRSQVLTTTTEQLPILGTIWANSWWKTRL